MIQMWAQSEWGFLIDLFYVLFTLTGWIPLVPALRAHQHRRWATGLAVFGTIYSLISFFPILLLAGGFAAVRASDIPEGRASVLILFTVFFCIGALPTALVAALFWRRSHKRMLLIHTVLAVGLASASFWPLWMIAVMVMESGNRFV